MTTENRVTGMLDAQASLIDQMRRHYGPVTSNELGVVNFRYDHYLNIFDQKIRPLHEDQQVKYSLALDSRRWEHQQNNKVHRSTVNSWVKAGLAEVWNHGTDHEDHSSQEAIHDFIAQSKCELEYDLRDAKIWGFAVPGVGGTRFNGFGAGVSLNSFRDKYAGQTILNYHAVSTGYRPQTTFRKMDGVVRPGQAHFGIEECGFSEIKETIDEAIDTQTAVTLMMHPAWLDKNARITSDTLRETIGYVRKNIDAGRLADLSMYESHIATK